MDRRIVFFDIDGTLLASGGAGQKAMEQTLTEEFGISFPFDGVLTSGRTDFGIVTEIFQRHGIPPTTSCREHFRQAYLDRLPRCLIRHRGLILPGVEPLLAELSARDELTLALLTGNFREGAWIKLRHFRLDRFFKFGGFGDCHACRNDVAAAARIAAEQIAGRPVSGRQCCVVGDTPADIHCARSIGADAVSVATGMWSIRDLKSHRPDHLFADLSDPGVVAAVVRPRR